ncbi:hypothetical protein PENTCL1PPCAC_29645 [Pristionchus entomophagus]|uniref:Peptidase S9 prolyl oligopeptidase catalytic domain-containing protein n=1 Tax=Pristionchus entomophagus TaxID=358040 RepID=A0AAV5UKC1_9BILA|nr:hypothetical protein PENTCL1PPCAC_29645 [Pristionchus entomophagus]
MTNKIQSESQDITYRFFNVYKFDLLKNELSLVLKNSRFPQIYTDNEMKIRLVSELQEDGTEIFFRVFSEANPDNLTSDNDDWEEYFRVESEDYGNTSFAGFDKTNEHVYLIWGEDTNFGQLISESYKDFNQKEVIYAASRAPISKIAFHPQDRTLLAITEKYHYPIILAVNQTVRKEILKNHTPDAYPEIINWSQDMKTWLVTHTTSERSSDIFIYHREINQLELMFNEMPALEGYRHSKMIGFDFAARDGLIIQAYLALPPDLPLKDSSTVSDEDKLLADQGIMPVSPQKLVVYVHGGPQLRDSYGYDTMAAMLTNRGYAVLRANFRGSMGFGKKLRNAGYGE